MSEDAVDLSITKEALASEFEGKLHLHLVPCFDAELPHLHTGWREWIEEEELWYTLWDVDAIETELLTSFGEAAVQRAREMSEEQRAELWLCLTVYLEGGVAFTSEVDLVDRWELISEIPGGDGILLVSSNEGSHLLAGSEGSERLKKIISRLLQAEPREEDDEIYEQCELLELDLVEWLRDVRQCGCDLSTSEGDSEEGEEGGSEDESEEGEEGGSEDESEEGEEGEE